MKPAPFKYIRPDTVAEALSALTTHADAKVLAGGQSLCAMLNLRLAKPAAIVDISQVPELNFIRREGEELVIGAGVTQSDVLLRPDLAEEVPLLAKALTHVGHFQTRNRGTICGSLCHADPSSEIPLCLAVLGGRVTIASRRGRRQVSADAFQMGMLTTAAAPDELVAEARFPLADEKSSFAFNEVARRKGDFAIVAVAAWRHGDQVTLGVGGIAARPHVTKWENLLEGDIDAALDDLAWRLEAESDIHATARYRRELVRRVGRRTILETADV